MAEKKKRNSETKLLLLKDKLAKYQQEAIFPKYPQDTLVVGTCKGRQGEESKVIGYYVAPWRRKHVIYSVTGSFIIANEIYETRNDASEKKGGK